jgi:hypothetical protein
MAADTAANIVKSVIEKSTSTNGKEAPPAKAAVAAPVVPVDPNAGKEKYSVDGKDIYLTPDEARNYVQKGIAFEPKISQLGRLQHETAAFLQQLQDDPAKIIYNERFGTPEEVLSKLLNSTKVSDKIKDTIGQWYYKNVYEIEQMTPEQREALTWKEKAEAHDRMVQQQAQDRIEQENQQRVNQALGVLKAQINEAMSEAGVPLESKIAPQLARRCAQVMQAGYRVGQTVTPKEAMRMVKNEILETQKSYYDVLDEDKLVEQLGKENAEKVRKYYLKAVKEADKDKPKNNFRSIPKRDERKTKTPDEFRAYLDELKKNS